MAQALATPHNPTLGECCGIFAQVADLKNAAGDSSCMQLQQIVLACLNLQEENGGHLCDLRTGILVTEDESLDKRNDGLQSGDIAISLIYASAVGMT